MSTWTLIDSALDDMRMLATLGREQYESRPGLGAESVLYPALPASVYHADREALSCSMLKPLLLSPAHYQSALLQTTGGSPARTFGSLVHLLLLEPERVSAEIAVYPGIGDARDRDFKAFLARNSHRLAVDEPTFARAKRLVDKTSQTKFRGRALGKFIEESMCECSLYFTEPITELRLRVRFDALHPDISFDLKTTRHATPEAFARDAVALGYDLQGYLYSLARSQFEGTSELKPFVFVSAETAAPYSVCTHAAGGTFMENGRAKLQECLTTFKACTMVQHWPDLSCDKTLEIAPWQQYVPGGEWRGPSEDMRE